MWRACRECEKLLGAWSDAANAHSRIVARFADTSGDRFGLQDQAEEALEAVVGAEYLYRHHREEHSGP